MKATLAVTRGVPGEPARVESFELDFAPGQSVLDGLRMLRSDADETLAFRFACINANACTKCCGIT